MFPQSGRVWTLLHFTYLSCYHQIVKFDLYTYIWWWVGGDDNIIQHPQLEVGQFTAFFKHIRAEMDAKRLQKPSKQPSWRGMVIPERIASIKYLGIWWMKIQVHNGTHNSYESLSYVYNVGKTWENNNRPSPISPSIGGIKWYKPFPDGWFIIVFTTLLYALSLGWLWMIAQLSMSVIISDQDHRTLDCEISMMQ